MSRQSLAWLTAGAAVLVLATPLRLVWARASAGWIAPFIIWLVLIVVAGWLARSSGDDL